MALAIQLDELIRDGEVTDKAELARLGHVTRARLTQTMNLLCLAPDLQEKGEGTILADDGARTGRGHGETTSADCERNGLAEAAADLEMPSQPRIIELHQC